MKADYRYIVGRLQAALAADSRVSMLDIKIIVSNDRIHLTGQVNSENKRKAAEQVCLELFPDLEIRNELSTIEVAKPSQPEVIK